MQPLYIDIAFALLAFGLLALGWRRGFVRMAGGLASLLISVGCGAWGVGWIEGSLGIPLSQSIIGLVVAFLTIAVLVAAIVNIIVSLLDLARRLITLIPGFGLLNRLGGVAVGVLEWGVIVLACSYLAMYALADGEMRTLFLASQVMMNGARALVGLGI